MRAARLALALLALAPATASAQSKKDCADAYVSAQVDRKEGRLVEARKKFEVCAAASCPAALKRDCGPWLEQVDKELPALSVKVEGADGARITVDGAALDPGARLDPGEHVVRVEAAGMKPSEQRVRLTAGEGRREIAVKLEREAAGPAETGARLPIAPIALGAVGVLGLGLFIGLGAAGNARKGELDDLGCKPNCSPGSVSTIKTFYVGADVSLGFGLASLAAAGVLLGLHLAAPKQAAAVASRVGLAPGRGGVTLRF